MLCAVPQAVWQRSFLHPSVCCSSLHWPSVLLTLLCALAVLGCHAASPHHRYTLTGRAHTRSGQMPLSGFRRSYAWQGAVGRQLECTALSFKRHVSMQSPSPWRPRPRGRCHCHLLIISANGFPGPCAISVLAILTETRSYGCLLF